MFITAMAANPLAVNLAAAEGINISWGLWAMAGIVPGLICLLTVPLILYALYPPGEGTGPKQLYLQCSVVRFPRSRTKAVGI
jgi:di/tricarboxylate transporter